ncbi:uncharacterized protein TNCV_1581971 [Trichonephila clavipes]|nr:uncharacterized protein TNCV_1581971 [Trichonephila clavipes]
MAIFNNRRSTWSVHRSEYIVLGVMNLLNPNELLISEKESLPVVFSEHYEFNFFSEELKFSQLVRLQSKLRFCYSPVRYVTYSRVKSDLSHKSLGFLWTQFFRWLYDSFKCLQCVSAHFLDVDHHCQAL